MQHQMPPARPRYGSTPRLTEGTGRGRDSGCSGQIPALGPCTCTSGSLAEQWFPLHKGFLHSQTSCPEQPPFPKALSMHLESRGLPANHNTQALVSGTHRQALPTGGCKGKRNSTGELVVHFRGGLGAIGTAPKPVRNEVKQPEGLRAGRAPRPGGTAAATSHARRLQAMDLSTSASPEPQMLDTGSALTPPAVWGQELTHGADNKRGQQLSCCKELHRGEPSQEPLCLLCLM